MGVSSGGAATYAFALLSDRDSIFICGTERKKTGAWKSSNTIPSNPNVEGKHQRLSLLSLISGHLLF